MPNILVVDDQTVLVSILESVLTKNGHHVSTAADGTQALAIAEMTRPDLIMLDANMPVMDGFETLKRLREKPQTAAIPVLMLTASRTEADVRTSLKLGADDYLCKPFNIDHLLARVSRLLKRAPGAAAGRLCA